MKRIMPYVLSLSLVALLSFTATGTAVNRHSSISTVQLSDAVVNEMLGRDDPGWVKYLEVFGCGVGIVASVATFPTITTGYGLILWAALASGTAALCGVALT